MYINIIDKLTSPTEGMTKAERLSDIRENRKEEKEALREEEAFTASARTRNGRMAGPAVFGSDPFEMTEEEWKGLSPIERMLWEDVKREGKRWRSGR